MKLESLEKVRASVQMNCHISDARHGASYGLCTYLLKMREYFRWERGYGFDDSLENDEVGQWISEREGEWESLEAENFVPIPIEGTDHDPFDNASINAALVDHGLVYSGGTGNAGRPHFFLGELILQRSEGAGSLLLSGRELARDLTSPPAMTRDGMVFVRRESLRRMLWEKLDGWRWHRIENPLGRALACYPFEQDLDAALEQMTDNEVESVMLHEQGEVHAGDLLGESWGSMQLDFVQTPAELVARAVRDHLADCLVTLPRLAELNRPASIHFYLGNLSAMRKTLFPGLQAAYAEWLESNDASGIRAIARRGSEHWLGVGREIVELHRTQRRGAVRVVAGLAETRRM